MTVNLIHISDIYKRAGSHKDVHLIIEDEEFTTSFAKVVDEVTCDFKLESITNGIVVRGTINGNYEAKCGYGLENFTESFTYNVNELFEHGHKLSAKKEKSTFALADDDDEEEDLYSFEGADIDVSQMVRDTILTNLPIAPVCSHGPENCTVCEKEVLPYLSKGLPEQVRSSSHPEQVQRVEGSKKDPRWSALDDMLDSLDLDDK